tara:strand:- start:212 stop:346 length:135 start_codon:yes stop_codon:yes gene_type:complete
MVLAVPLVDGVVEVVPVVEDQDQRHQQQVDLVVMGNHLQHSQHL